jgi:leader peptidase (prepilin peptidase)/N-methyltransferase
MVALLVIALLAGLAAGSFATAVAHRVPRGIDLATSRSECPACGAPIAARDNIPIASWLLLRGHARCCGAGISPRYPLTELATAVLFVAAALVHQHESFAEIAIDWVFITTLAAITLTDLEQRIIPNKILLVAAILCLAVAVPTDPGGVPERLIAAAGAGAAFFLVVLAYPQGLGLGDVKLAATMGLFLGRAVAPAIFAALLIGSAVGLILIARYGSSARKMAIPFGPFLALGGIIGMLVGNQVLDAYLG